MPFSVRLSDRELGELRHRALIRGITPSAQAREFIRRGLGLDEAASAEADERLEDHERRLARLEEMAGL